jgi:hypothetical protein
MMEIMMKRILLLNLLIPFAAYATQNNEQIVPAPSETTTTPISVNVDYLMTVVFQLPKPYAGTGYHWTLCNYDPSGPLKFKELKTDAEQLNFTFKTTSDPGHTQGTFISFNLLPPASIEADKSITYDITIGNE